MTAMLASFSGWEVGWEYVGRLALAAVLGSIIGLEREYHGRSAGFRGVLAEGGRKSIASPAADQSVVLTSRWKA